MSDTYQKHMYMLNFQSDELRRFRHVRLSVNHIFIYAS